MLDVKNLCTPAKIYLAIAVISALYLLFNGFAFLFVFVKLVFAIVWSFILGWLCKKGFSSISWFLLLFPYIIMILAMLNIYHMSYEHKQMIKSVGLQDVYGQ